MPLLDGEGAVKFFRRLQIEIVRQSFDESLFAWRSEQSISGFLAHSPSFFARSGLISTYPNACGLSAFNSYGEDRPGTSDSRSVARERVHPSLPELL